MLYEDATTATDARFITKQNWVAYCNTDGSVLVISPDGTKYTMSYYKRGEQTYTLQTDQAWYTTRIEDRNGNYLTIEYDTTVVSYGLDVILKRITASDGRIVDFTYVDRTLADKIRLGSITANGQTWTYGYTLLAGYSSTHFLLTRVTRPDGLAWNYAYHDKTTGQPGDNIVKQVTYPYGATATYDYGYVCFNATTCSSIYDSFYSLVVTSKINGGRDVVPATWTYAYAPSSTEDVTTVTFPGGKYVYKHHGIKAVFSASATVRNLWRTGLLKEKQTYSGTTLVNQEIYTWQNLNLISNEEHVLPPYDGSIYPYVRYSDPKVYAPVLTQKQIIRDGTTYTTAYSNFDASYNPRTITETGQATRTTNLTYFPRNSNQNIVNLVKDETISGELTGKNVYRTFDTKGNLTRIVRRGVQEDYTYYTNGDLWTKTNARGNKWTYSNYYRGVPRTEIDPLNIQITRVVNATGTIASEKNGRGYITSYSYNGMNRIISITRPVGAVTSVAWSTTGRTVTRGTYSQVTTFDGFGRVSYISTGGITTDVNYDALGFKSFESYPSFTTGTTYANDTLGRVTKIIKADNSSIIVQYQAGNKISKTDERGFATIYTYRSFGDPDNSEEKVLASVTDPTGTTSFSRNILGQLLSVTKGGVTRAYSYSTTNNFLTGVNNPETGQTTIGRDAIGNMTSRKIGASGVTYFTYDAKSRLTRIDYPSASAYDVSLSHDANDNVVSISNTISQRGYSYDGNDNLSSESLSVNGKVFNASYGYNTLDYLDSITYPSSKVLSYAPDSLGRATKVGAFVTSVAYHPSGIPSRLSLANGIQTNIALNNRLWTQRISSVLATTNKLDISYGYDVAGNVTSIADALNGAYNRTLAYDGVNRLVSSTGPGGGSIAYDAADNITSKFGSTYAYSSNRLSSVSGLYSFSYDTYGNVTSNGPYSFAYDDAGNLRSAVGGKTASYDYDGSDMRVLTSKDGIDIYSFYAKNGNLLGEYSALKTALKEYFYLGNKLVAMMENPDSDNDGLADVWEIKYFNSLAYGPNDDPDGDGLTNLQEYEGGSSPVAATRGVAANLNATVGAGVWELAKLLETASGAAMTPQVAVDSTGNALAVWTQSDGTRANIWAARYLAASGWGAPELIETENLGDATAPQITVDTNGNALAVWSQSDGTVTNIWGNRYVAGTGWGSAQLLESASGAAMTPQIAVDSTGNALAVWTQSDGTRANLWAARYLAGSGWGAPEVIEFDNLGDATAAQIAVDANGNALAVWSQSDGTRANLWAARYLAGSGWGAPEVIEFDNLGDATAAQIAVDANGNALAVWSQSDGTVTNIWGNRYVVAPQ